MEEIMINSGYLIPIILIVVGLLKLPLIQYKAKLGGWYTAVLTILTLVVATSACITGQLFLLGGTLFTLDFAMLCATVFSGVFITYNGLYEGLQLKELIHNLWDKILTAKNAKSDSKIAKYINKVGVDKITAVVNTITATELPKAETTEENKSA